MTPRDWTGCAIGHLSASAGVCVFPFRSSRQVTCVQSTKSSLIIVMSETTTKRPRSSFNTEPVYYEPGVKMKRVAENLSLQELYLRGTHLLLTAAKYKPYLQWRSDDFSTMVRTQEALSSADTASSVTSSASENGNSPHYDGCISPAYVPMVDTHHEVSTFPAENTTVLQQSSTLVSPPHNSDAGSPAHHSGTDSADGSYISSPPHDQDEADPFDFNDRLSGDGGFHESFEITCWCLKPHGSRNMIFCSECERWLHFSCVKIRKDPNPDGEYMCPKCVARKETKRKSARQRAHKKRFDP